MDTKQSQLDIYFICYLIVPTTCWHHAELFVIKNNRISSLGTFSLATFTLIYLQQVTKSD